jgi:hypothetical protein
MTDTNYITGIVRILEIPKKRIVKNNISVTEFRAQLPQFRNKRIVKLTFWGNLARYVTDSFKVNDYILIEGYIKLSKTKTQTSKKVEITVLKAYPFLLNYDRTIRKG